MDVDVTDDDERRDEGSRTIENAVKIIEERIRDRSRSRMIYHDYQCITRRAVKTASQCFQIVVYTGSEISRALKFVLYN